MARAPKGDEGRYQIVDEPSPGPLARFAVQPMLPFLAFMIVPWAGIPFFLFNTLALKGRTWVREILLLSIASVLRFGIPHSVAVWMVGQGVPVNWMGYIAVLPLAASLWLGYRVFHDQSVTHQMRAFFAPEGVAR